MFFEKKFSKEELIKYTSEVAEATANRMAENLTKSEYDALILKIVNTFLMKYG